MARINKKNLQVLVSKALPSTSRGLDQPYYIQILFDGMMKDKNGI